MHTLKEYVSEGLRKGYSKEELAKNLAEKGYSKKEIESLFDEPAKEDLKQDNKTNQEQLDFFAKIGYLFSNPNKFFSSVRDSTIWQALGMYIACTVFVGAILTVLSMALANSIIGNWVFGMFGVGLGIFFVFFSFIYAGITHGFSKVFGGKGSYVDTYNCLVYSLVPGTLLTIIPLIGTIGSIYSLILTVIGLSKYHEISIGKSIGVIICSSIIGIILIIALIFGLLSVYW
jgi:hypothetical protein